MRNLCQIPAFLLFCLALPAIAADHTQPLRCSRATSFPAVEVHADEHVAIAVEPYDTKEKSSIFRVDYLGHDVMPVRLIITNQEATGLSVCTRRTGILCDGRGRTDSGCRGKAGGCRTADDGKGSAKVRKFPCLGPLPPIRTKPEGQQQKRSSRISTAFEYSALAVEPHTTRWIPVLRCFGFEPSANRGQASAEDNSAMPTETELFFFEIPFSKYLQSKSNQMN